MADNAPDERTQLNWQHQALDLLAYLLDMAADRGLPPITWTVHAVPICPGLTGHPGPEGQPVGTDQAPAFRAWHKAITSIAGPEHPDHGSSDDRVFYYWGEFMGVTLMLDADTQPRTPG